MTAGTACWQPRIVPLARQKYLGVVEALAEDIGAGLLQAGDRLPAQRHVARALGVDLTTVTRAFNAAQKRGLIVATTGRGTFVADGALAAAPAMPPPLAIDLSMNSPPQPGAAALARLIPETMARLLSGRQGASLLAYQDGGGALADREVGALWLAPRLGAVEADRIVIAAGAQHALYGICASLCARGDTIAAPCLTYPGLHAVATQLGLRLSPLAVDTGGLVPAAFEALCRAERPAALYLVPTVDNPTTVTLSPERRRQIAAIARRFGVPIVEDDPYGMLPEAPPAPLATLAPELTWHIATLSKCASPALRIAYVVTPDRMAASRLAAAVRAICLMAAPLMAALASDWIRSGTLAAVTRAIRAENAARQAMAAATLVGQTFGCDPHGHHLWLSLPPGWKADLFAAQAERGGLSVVPASAFAIGPVATEAVRLSLGPPANREMLHHALVLLQALLTSLPHPGRAIV